MKTLFKLKISLALVGVIALHGTIVSAGGNDGSYNYPYDGKFYHSSECKVLSLETFQYQFIDMITNSTRGDLTIICPIVRDRIYATFSDQYNPKRSRAGKVQARAYIEHSSQKENKEKQLICSLGLRSKYGNLVASDADLSDIRRTTDTLAMSLPDIYLEAGALSLYCILPSKSSFFGYKIYENL